MIVSFQKNITFALLIIGLMSAVSILCCALLLLGSRPNPSMNSHESIGGDKGDKERACGIIRQKGRNLLFKRGKGPFNIQVGWVTTFADL